MLKFYVAKVVKSEGRRSHPITLFATDDGDARKQVAESKFGYKHEAIYVADLATIHQEQFGRWADDGFGLAEHDAYDFTDNGPINTVELFKNRRAE